MYTNWCKEHLNLSHGRGPTLANAPRGPPITACHWQSLPPRLKDALTDAPADEQAAAA